MKKVALLGYCPSWKTAPFTDGETEIWIMNDMFELVPRYDRLFEIHMIEEIKTRITRGNGVSQYEKIKGIVQPIIMQDHYTEIPSSIKFPMEYMKEKYYINAMGDKIFLTCTVAFMLLMAIEEGFEQIELYGIHEDVDGEYKDEMPGVLYWLGYAHAKGIKIKISEDSPLMKGWFVYGYEEKKFTHYQKFIQDELTRVRQISENSKVIQHKYLIEQAKCDGAAAILEHIQKITSEI